MHPCKSDVSLVSMFLSAVVVLQVFVWIGNEAHEEEKSEAMASGKARSISHS